MGGVVLKLTYGAVKDGELDFAQMSLGVVRAISDVTSGNLVDLFPICEVQSLLLNGSLIQMMHYSEIHAWMDARGRI